jgi:hypothetical protein
MKFALILACVSFAYVAAQTPAPPAPVSSAAGSASAASGSIGSLLPDLDRLQAAAAQASVNISHLRIDKWKTDSQSKQQAQNNADSIQRNLTAALPGLIESVRAAPQDLPVVFKLYRNLNALHDVFGSLAESVGAFGPKNDYAALAEQFQTIASVQRNLGDAVESLAVSTQLELNQLRVQVRAQQPPAAVPPPKKVVVDDTAPASKKVPRKKKASGTSGGASSDEPSSNPGPEAAPKS